MRVALEPAPSLRVMQMLGGEQNSHASSFCKPSSRIAFHAWRRHTLLFKGQWN
jgi:hypothetical protein